MKSDGVRMKQGKHMKLSAKKFETKIWRISTCYASIWKTKLAIWRGSLMRYVPELFGILW